jgi:hypothetical protein
MKRFSPTPLVSLREPNDVYFMEAGEIRKTSGIIHFRLA